MSKYEFINNLMQMYYDGLNYLRDNCNNQIDFYEHLNSEDVASKLYESISQFLNFDYDETKLQILLEIKKDLFENAICLNNIDLYADVLYGISCDGLDWHLEDIKIWRKLWKLKWK